MKKVYIKAYTKFNLGNDLFIRALCNRYSDVKFYLVADEKYKEAFKDIKNLEVKFVNKNLIQKVLKLENKTEHKWFLEVINVVENSNSDDSNDTTDGMVMKDGVPIPTGFTYKEGTKDTGLVIQDENGNEFVWVVANEKTYVRDTTLPSEYGNYPTGDDTLPNGITDETADVIKYGGFYIGRYEAGISQGDTETSNKTGVPVSKKGATVWTDIDYDHAKASAESMIKSDYVQTGLLTGTAWDTTCHWIEDSLSSINASATLKDSRYYGNFIDSLEPANENHGTKQVAGFNENWKLKNIYDFAGNVWEWTSETFPGFREPYVYVYARGSSVNNPGGLYPVTFRGIYGTPCTNFDAGFRVRLYIK